MTLRSRLITLSVAFAMTVGMAPATSTATPGTPAEERIAALLPARIAGDATLGGRTAGLVVDARTGRFVWGTRQEEGRLPASTTKIATAIAALTALGSRTRLTTEVRTTPYRTGFVLRAGGDPELQSAHLDQLAARTAAALAVRGVPRIVLWVDDALFGETGIAPGWRSSYVPGEVPVLRGLTYDRRYTRDTAMDAGRRLAQLLDRRGVTVVRVERRQRAATTGRLAAVQGWTIAQITSRMINVSSNADAEYLARLVAIRTGKGTSWSAVRWGVRSMLRRAGISLTGFEAEDGSGLSRSNRISPLALVRMLRHIQRTPALAAVLFAPGAFPRSGLDGTLGNRYASRPASCAKARVQAKTGTLTGAVALAGRTTGRDGRVKLFAFVVNGTFEREAARAGVDRLASTVTGCW